VRADKLALAAIEATLDGPVPPVLAALRTSSEALRARTDALAARLGGRTVAHDGRVGGGGGAGVPVPGWAIALEQELAAPLRTGDPAVVGTVQGGACLLDLRCIPAEQEDGLVAAGAAAREQRRSPGAEGTVRGCRSSPPPGTPTPARPHRSAPPPGS